MSSTEHAMSVMRRSARGMTLTEVLIASAVAAVVVGGINAFMNSSARIEQDLRNRSGALSEQTEAALAMVHVAKRLEVADRIILVAPDNIQLRIPPEDYTKLGDRDEYHWERYALDASSGEFRFFPAGDCGTPRILSREIVGASFTFVNRFGLNPPGGPCQPNGTDCNMVDYWIRWDNGLNGSAHQSHILRSRVSSRHIAETHLGTAIAGDSGNQLLMTAPDPPPVGAC